MDFLLNIDWVQAIVVSTVTSFIFLLFLTIFRPRLRISRLILYRVKKDKNKAPILKDGKEQRTYTIKVVNWTFRNLIENKLELRIVKPFGGGKGISVKSVKIPLKSTEVLDFPSMISKRGRKNARYAKVFTINADLEKIWTEDYQYLEFRFFSKHGLSGYSKLTVKLFTDMDVIQEGTYGYGRSLNKKVF